MRSEISMINPKTKEAVEPPYSLTSLAKRGQRNMSSREQRGEKERDGKNVKLEQRAVGLELDLVELEQGL